MGEVVSDAELYSLSVKVYKRVLYLMTEGFTEDQAQELAAKEFGLDG